MQGKSTCLSEQNVAAIGCPGAGYWNCNVATVPSEHVAYSLAVEEGLKASSDLMCQWLENQPPYKREHTYIVIGPLRKKYYQYLKTITFYVNPDQLSLLITGAEYCNASDRNHPVTAVYGSGCGQLAVMFADYINRSRFYRRCHDPIHSGWLIRLSLHRGNHIEGTE